MEPMTEPVLLTSLDDGVLRLTLNRPEQRNAIDTRLRRALLEALDDAVELGARVILIRANGSSFCAGADLGGSKPAPGVGTLRRMRVSTHRLITELIEHPLPVVAAVQGSCAGYGVSIALAADFCVVADDAIFLPAFTKVGLAPDGAIALTLTRALGVVGARRFLMLGESITGQQAAASQMVHAAVPASDLDGTASDIAATLAAGAVAAVSAAKSLIARATAGELEALLVEERTVQAVLTTTPDHREGVQAVMERRPPVFGKPDSD
jgi:enoyl-CoA hydratase/carnithine racemase